MFFVCLFVFSDCVISGSHGSDVPQVLQPGSHNLGRPVPTAVESAHRQTTTSKSSIYTALPPLQKKNVRIFIILLGKI